MCLGVKKITSAYFRVLICILHITVCEEAPTLGEFDAFAVEAQLRDTGSLDHNCGFSLGYY